MAAVKRSNEGGREVSLGGGSAMGDGDMGTPKAPGENIHRRRDASSLGAGEPMRVETEASFPGADSDEGVQSMIAAAAEQIARKHPSYEGHVRSVKAKLQRAIDECC